MTEEQKRKIKKLKSEGHSYREISNLTSVPEGTIKSFLSRNKNIPEKTQKVCKFCGKPIVSLAHHKQRQFCSRECGLLWWHQNPDFLDKKTVYTFTCPSCGKAFSVYGQSSRKYCSHKCYINARFKGVVYEV